MRTIEPDNRFDGVVAKLKEVGDDETKIGIVVGELIGRKGRDMLWPESAPWALIKAVVRIMREDVVAALKDKPSYVRGRYLYAMEMDPALALEAFMEDLEGEDPSAEAAYNCALVILPTNKTEALVYLQKASLEGRYLPAHVKIMELLREREKEFREGKGRARRRGFGEVGERGINLISYLKRACEVFPELLFDLGQELMSLGDAVGAEEYFVRAIEHFDENRADAFLNLGILALEQRDYHAAEDYFKEAQALGGEEADVFLMQCCCEQDEDMDLDEALRKVWSNLALMREGGKTLSAEMVIPDLIALKVKRGVGDERQDERLMHRGTDVYSDLLKKNPSVWNRLKYFRFLSDMCQLVAANEQYDLLLNEQDLRGITVLTADDVLVAGMNVVNSLVIGEGNKKMVIRIWQAGDVLIRKYYSSNGLLLIAWEKAFQDRSFKAGEMEMMIEACGKENVDSFIASGTRARAQFRRRPDSGGVLKLMN